MWEKRWKAGTQGFTLLELLMVVIIIGILASIALPQYLRVTERARATEALSTLGAIRTSEHRFRAQSSNNSYGPLLELDITSGTSTLWGIPAVTFNGSGTAAVGFVQVLRLGTGSFAGQALGITFGTGRICGDFNPSEPITPCAPGD